MTDEELRLREHSPAISLKFLAILGAISVIMTVAIIVSTTMRLDSRAEEDRIRDNNAQEQVDALNKSNSASVCVVSLFHALSQSSGKGQEATQASFKIVFSAEWLKANCRFTDEEVNKVLKPTGG